MLRNLVGFTTTVSLLAMVVLLGARLVLVPARDLLTGLFGQGAWLLCLAPLYAVIAGIPAFMLGYVLGGLGLAIRIGAGGAASGVGFIVAVALIYPEED
jgi:hypothetical protein